MLPNHIEVGKINVRKRPLRFSNLVLCILGYTREKQSPENIPNKIINLKEVVYSA